MGDMLTFLQQYGAALALVGNIVVLVLASKFVTRDAHAASLVERDGRIKVLAEKVDAAEDRVAKLESEFRHLPDRRSVHGIELSLSDLKGELRAMGEQLKPVAAISDRLQEFLLEQAKR
ncbi:MAG: DUF2730 family protein [Bosea sp.]|nr:DUF2730 family protein [Bosea sp. (in: a-proteobacteria)]